MNPLPQRSIAKRLKIAQSTVNQIIHEDLGLIKRKKCTVYSLKDSHRKNRKVNTRKRYENHLAGKRDEYVVTLDEPMVYLDDALCKV